MSAWTGNWTVEQFDPRYKGGQGKVEIFDLQRRVAAVEYGPGKRTLAEAEEIARLVAAGPRLRSVLANLLEWAKGQRGSKSINPYMVPEVKAALKLLAEMKGHRGKLAYLEADTEALSKLNPRQRVTEAQYQQFKKEWIEAGGYVGRDESLFRGACKSYIRKGMTGGEALKDFREKLAQVTRLNPRARRNPGGSWRDAGGNLYELRKLLKEYGATLQRTGREVVLTLPERAQQVYPLLVHNLAEYVAVLRRYPDDFGIIAESRPKDGLYAVQFNSPENAASFVSGVLG